MNISKFNVALIVELKIFSMITFNINLLFLGEVPIKYVNYAMIVFLITNSLIALIVVEKVI
jgi:hypothetical protein